jgi:type I site-specific restriction endonuclease
MDETPEQKARREIDADLTAAGWLVQDRDDVDLSAGRGIAVRNFTMKSGFGFAIISFISTARPLVPSKRRPRRQAA